MTISSWPIKILQSIVKTSRKVRMVGSLSKSRHQKNRQHQQLKRLAWPKIIPFRKLMARWWTNNRWWCRYSKVSNKNNRARKVNRLKSRLQSKPKMVIKQLCRATRQQFKLLKIKNWILQRWRFNLKQTLPAIQPRRCSRTITRQLSIKNRPIRSKIQRKSKALIVQHLQFNSNLFHRPNKIQTNPKIPIRAIALSSIPLFRNPIRM